MGFWALVRFVIQWVPVAIQVVTSIVKAIRELKDPREQAIAYNELWHAVKQAEASGDVGGIEAMKDRCGLRAKINRKRAEQGARRDRRST